MLQGNDNHSAVESPIFSELSLYRVFYSGRDERPVMVHNNGGVSVIIPFSGINNTSFDEGIFEQIFKGIQRVLEEIPPGIVTVQFISLRTNNIENKETKNLPRFLRPRADHFNFLAQNNEVFKNEYYLSIFVAQPLVPTKDRILDFLKKTFLKKDPLSEQYNKVMDSVEQRISVCFEISDQFLTMFREMGISFHTLKNKEEYYNILQKFTRPEKSKQEFIKIDEEDVPRQALFSGVRANVNKTDFTLDDTLHKVYTLDRAPKDYIFGRSFEVLHAVPFEYIYSISFRTLSHQEAISVFKYRLAEKRMASGSNESAIVEDRSLIAEEQRVSDSYDMFAFGEAIGTYASVNMVLKIKESHIEKEMRRQKLSREEIIRKIDYRVNKDIFPRFGNSEWICEDNTGFPVFCQLIPGHSNIQSNVQKVLFLSSENVPYFLPLWDTSRPVEHDGINHFIDEKGNYITFDLMDPSMPAWNYCISGETGSGKSVLMNALLTMQFAEAVNKKPPIICILDVGGERGSYIKFMELIKGTTINLSGIKKPHIQMFSLNPELSLPTPKKIKDLAELFKSYAKHNDFDRLRVDLRNFYINILDKGRNNLDDNEYNKLFFDCLGFELPEDLKEKLILTPGECEPTGKTLNLIMGILEVILSTSSRTLDGYRNFDYDQVLDMVLELYRNIPGRFPYMSDFYEFVKTRIDEASPQGRKFLTKIKNWTRDGAYSMFDMDTDIDLSNDVTLVDLKGLQNEPNLQLIYTLLFSELFSNKMYFTRGRRKLMVRDEAWSIMNNDKARKYLVEDLRTARKSGFATITISQLPTDFLYPDRQDGKAILANMQAHMLGLFRLDSVVRDVAQELNLNPEMAEVLKELGQHKEIQNDGSFKTVYARFMLKIGSEIYLLRNILHPFEAILYSSSEEDNAIIDYYIKISKQYESLEDVLWLISQNNHVGDQGLLSYLEKAGYKNAARKVRGGR